ncbi:MAG: antitoxin MazE family protein [Xanthobacteraceae bacterium]|nr:antitoxin MazE family protein [Xanthobacteraceae bacterium]
MSRTSRPKAKAKSRPKSSRDKVRAHRARLRKQGLRPIQIWVPDVRSPEFRAEAHRASLAAAQSPTEADDQAVIDAITDPDALYERRRD